MLRERFPNAIFYFQPADIITQVLNFGVPAPIDIQVSGKDRGKDAAGGATGRPAACAACVGAVDVHLQQIVDAPEFFVDVDRVRAAELGLTEQQVAQKPEHLAVVVLPGLAQSSGPTPQAASPTSSRCRRPEYRTNSLTDVENTPLLRPATAPAPQPAEQRGDPATPRRCRLSPATRTRSRPMTSWPMCRTGRWAPSSRT